MAEINFGLLDTQLPGRIATIPLQAQEAGQANALRAMQMMQGMQQNEASQMQLQKLRREQNTLNQIQAAIVASGGPPDLKAAADAMLRSGDIEHVKLARSIYDGIRNQENAAKYRTQYMGPETAPAPSENALPGMVQGGAPPAQGNALPGMAQGAAPGVAPGVADPSTALNAKISALERQYHQIGNNPELQSEKALVLKQIENVQRQLRDASALSPEVRLMQSLGYPITQAGFTAFRNAHSPDKIPTPPSMVAEYTFAKTPDGGGFRGSFQDFVKERASAGRTPPQPRAESPTEKVIDPVTGKQIIVSREEAIRGRMTPAAAMESLPPKEIQKREAALPAATSAVNGFDTKAKSFIKDLIALRDDVGLDQITGPIYGRTGSVSRAGSRAQALYDKIVAKGGFQALQDLRDASKTGGALGNVSNQEGKQLTASFAAIDQRQNAKDVQAAINQAIADIEGARTRTREAYDSTYSYKSSGGNTPAAPAVNIDALLDKYK